jgi:hypothetical protein
LLQLVRAEPEPPRIVELMLRREAKRSVVRGNTHATRVNDAQFFEFQRQPMTERAFRAQFVEQLLGSVERFQLNLAALEYLTPTARHLLLG